MPRPRKKADPRKRSQYNLSLSPEMAARVDETAAALGMTGTALVRSILHENLGVYEARAEAARRKKSAE